MLFSFFRCKHTRKFLNNINFDKYFFNFLHKIKHLPANRTRLRRI